jgi:hypothetical protein
MQFSFELRASVPAALRKSMWRPAFKIHLLMDTGVTFLLTTGGHNAGIMAD